MTYYWIYMNDQALNQHIDPTLRAAKKWVKNNILSTHMGEWIEHDDGYEYATTIGRYYRFRLEKRGEVMGV